MKRRMLGGMVFLALAGFGCGGPEESQAQAPAPQKKAPEERITETNRTPEEMRAELSKRIDAIGEIYEKVISVLQEVQAAKTGEWAIGRARSAVSNAKMRRDMNAEILQRKLKESKDSHLDRVEGEIAMRKRVAEKDLLDARRKLQWAQ